MAPEEVSRFSQLTGFRSPDGPNPCRETLLINAGLNDTHVRHCRIFNRRAEACTSNARRPQSKLRQPPETTVDSESRVKGLVKIGA